MLQFFTWNSEHQWFRMSAKGRYDNQITDTRITQLLDHELFKAFVIEGKPVVKDGLEAKLVVRVDVAIKDQTKPNGFSIL